MNQQWDVMARPVLIFLAWGLALMGLHRVMVAPWHRAHAEYLKAVVDDDAQQ
jgi:hypothetical protein